MLVDGEVLWSCGTYKGVWGGVTAVNICDSPQGVVKVIGKVTSQLTGVMVMGDCNGDRESVMVGSMFRSNLRVTIGKCEFKKLISISFSFSKLLPEYPTYHADSRNSKEIQGFCEHLPLSWTFLNLHGLLDFLLKACL